MPQKSLQCWLFCAFTRLWKQGCAAFYTSSHCCTELRAKPSRNGGINQERKFKGMLRFYEIFNCPHVHWIASRCFFFFFILSPVVRIHESIHHGSFQRQTSRMYSFVNSFSKFLYVFVFWQLRCFYFSTQKANLLRFSLLTSTSLHI